MAREFRKFLNERQIGRLGLIVQVQESEDYGKGGGGGHFVHERLVKNEGVRADFLATRTTSGSSLLFLSYFCCWCCWPILQAAAHRWSLSRGHPVCHREHHSEPAFLLAMSLLAAVATAAALVVALGSAVDGNDDGGGDHAVLSCSYLDRYFLLCGLGGGGGGAWSWSSWSSRSSWPLLLLLVVVLATERQASVMAVAARGHEASRVH